MKPQKKPSVATKTSTSTTKTSQPVTAGGTGATRPGGSTTGKHLYPILYLPKLLPNSNNKHDLGLDKNSKEVFIKKLQLCMKTYDYKDETKDVKGKVNYQH